MIITVSCRKRKRETTRVTATATAIPANARSSAGWKRKTSDCVSTPISRNSAPFSRLVASGQACSAWVRDSGVLSRFEKAEMIRPATTTARTPEAWICSAVR